MTAKHLIFIIKPHTSVYTVFCTLSKTLVKDETAYMFISKNTKYKNNF